jgi:hypothetical protein
LSDLLQAQCYKQKEFLHDASEGTEESNMDGSIDADVARGLGRV